MQQSQANCNRASCKPFAVLGAPGRLQESVACLTNTAVQSVIARCLGDPIFLEQARANAYETLARYFPDANTLEMVTRIDFTILAKLSGQLLRVRHAAATELLPATFHVLNVLGMEIDIFAAYAQQPPPVAPSDGYTQSVQLADFICRFVDEHASPALRLVRDIALHERRLIPQQHANGLRKRLPQPRRSRSSASFGRSPSREYGSLVPSWIAPVYVERFQTDVLSLQKNPRIALPALGSAQLSAPFNIAYVYLHACQCPRLFRVTDATAVLLSAVDGVRNIAALRQNIMSPPALASCPVHTVRQLFERLVNLGCLRLTRARS